MDANDRRRHATEKAAEFLVMLDDPRLSREAREEFVDWLRESPVHVAEMLRVAAVSNALTQFPRWSAIKGDAGNGRDDNVVTLNRAATGHGHRQRSRWTAIAIGLVALVVIIASLVWTSRGRTVETARGERREIILNDGSKLDLDPETRVRVNYSADRRDVFLDGGRAFFRVAKDAQRAFVVHSEGTLVRAVGTAFGVEREGNSLVVTVSEGKVAIAPPSSAPESAQVLLSAGEQIVVPRFSKARSVHRVDSARELAWAEGRLIFDNTPVSSVIEQFNRYNRIQLHVDDPGLAQRPVSGVFSASDPESFVAFLQGAIPVHVVRDGMQDITLSPGAN